ncbi:MAG: hypothetical protein WEA61_04910 [Anaerolineales bacterium]
MASAYPTLRILPTAALVPHEWHDEQRAWPLIERLRASGVLRNPPIVTPFDDGSGRFMVLDGANRSAAFSEIGMPHILAQVVKAEDPNLELKKWNHVLWNWDAKALVDSLSSIPDVSFRKIDPNIKRRQSQWPIRTLVWLQIPDGRAYVARSDETDLRTRASLLARIARIYVGKAQLDRTTAQRISELDGKYDNLTAVVVYPPFEVSEVLELCEAGILLPPGVTRFTVSPRALRVNYPLEELAADKPMEAKEEALQRWINERMARKGMRYYAEATVLYDE